MKREFLKNLGLEDTMIDQILDENSRDIGREKQKTDSAKTGLSDAQTQLSAVQTELETLKKSHGDIAQVQKQLSDLQAKYDADTGALSAQLAERDYDAAVGKAIAGKGLKFSSKSAERAFTAALKEKKLPLKDGVLDGFDDFLQLQRDADPDAFAPDKPVPKFTTVSGGNGAPSQPVSRAAQLAAEHHRSLYGETKKE